MSDQWRLGNEFLPFHPDASHVDPAYRDGWNACYRMAALQYATDLAQSMGLYDSSEPRRLVAENERLREFEREVVALLPGVYYMDPPDGGSVDPIEQLRRMSEDAERYRIARRKICAIGRGFQR